MLYQVLEALQSADGPISLEELSYQLGIEQSALEGMIAFWVRKGRLQDSAATACGGGCGSGGCAGCAFEQSGPRTITLS